MKFKLASALTFLVVLGFATLSCEKETEGENEKIISAYGDDESEDMDGNCMSCHIQGGEGEGWFNVAGTVYDSQKIDKYPDATVKLYTEPNGAGSVKYTIEVDALGNFFTTDSIDFGTGLYASVQGTASAKNMLMPVTTGQCNSCHGVSTDMIWTE